MAGVILSERHLYFYRVLLTLTKINSRKLELPAMRSNIHPVLASAEPARAVQ